jgi:hypothetical protein
MGEGVGFRFQEEDSSKVILIGFLRDQGMLFMVLVSLLVPYLILFALNP